MEIVKYLSIVLTVLLVFPLVSSLSLTCSELESEQYFAVNVISSGENYAKETVILDTETNYARQIYNNYSVELIDMYLTDEKNFKNVSGYKNIIENCIGVSFFNNSKEICSDFLPCISYSDIVPGADISIISKTLFLPYSEDVKMDVRFNSEIIAEEDISDLLCNNNNQCEGFENYYSCPIDCRINAEDGECIKQDEWESDGFCDSDCYYDFDCIALCKDGIKNGNEFYEDFGGSCGYENTLFCLNGKFDEEVEESVDCGGYCANECKSDLLSTLLYAQLYIQSKMTYEDVLRRIFNWVYN